MTTVPLRTIVVGVDGSAGADRALKWAASRALESGAALLATHVLTYSHEFATDLSINGLTNWRRSTERDLAGRWTEPARALGVTTCPRTTEGESAAAGILAVAEREHADLIVLGTHGRGGLADRLLGATTYVVSHRARTPVVIIPPACEVAETS